MLATESFEATRGMHIGWIVCSKLSAKCFRTPGTCLNTSNMLFVSNIYSNTWIMKCFITNKYRQIDNIYTTIDIRIYTQMYRSKEHVSRSQKMFWVFEHMVQVLLEYVLALRKFFALSGSMPKQQRLHVSDGVL